MCPPKSAQFLEASSSASDDSDNSSLHDSLYSSEDGSITDTLKTNWLRDRIKHEHGRQYMDSDVVGAFVPIDETQLDQLDMFHKIYTEAMTMASDPSWKQGGAVKLFRAPVGKNPQRILDIGTGTGLWAIDVADEYPSAQVIGFDNAPVQPRWVPPNVQFEVEHVESRWTYTPNSFDLVHARAMHAVIMDWSKFCKDVFGVTRPGGYFECFSEAPKVESDDNSIPKDWIFVTWLNNVEEALTRFGLKLSIEKTIRKDMEDAGFTNVTQEVYKVPIGPWPKDPKMKNLGAMFLINLLQGIEGWTLTLYTKALGWSLEDTMEHLDQIKKSLRNKKAHTYMRFINTVGQKPLSAGNE